jgi:hypothetical protein
VDGDAVSPQRDRAIRRQEFILALTEWKDRPLATFSRTIPPLHSIGFDDDQVLARVFAEIAAPWSCHTPRRAQEVLTAEIAFHERQRDRLLSDLRRDQTGTIYRRTHKDAKSFDQLIDVLSNWADAIHEIVVEQAWCAVPAAFEPRPAAVPALPLQLEPVA